MNSVFTFLEYREYLKEYYESRKSDKSFFSYRYFGKLVAMDSSLVAKVLIKERHIADDRIPLFVAACHLDGREAEYFANLVHFNKAKDDARSRVYFELLLKSQSVHSRRLEAAHYTFYTKWYYTAIRSLLEFHEFRRDYAALGALLSPPISAKEAKEAVKLLESLKLIRKDETGRYRMTDQAVTTGSQWRSLAIRAFQEETIRLAAESFERHPAMDRDMSTITLNISPEDVVEIRERLGEFRASIIQYVNAKSDPSIVYQLNLQLFPLSSRSEGQP